MSSGKRKLVQNVFKTINIRATDLAPLCYMDHYNNFPRIACDIWKSLDPVSYESYKLECYKKGNYVANDSMKQKMMVLNNKLTNNSVSIVNEVSKINKNKNSTSELNTKQESLIEKLDSEINKNIKANPAKKAELEKQQAELKKIVKSATNVVYGTKNEGNGYDFFELKTGQSLKNKQVYLNKKIADFTQQNKKSIPDIRWQIRGVADGLTTQNKLIEIKNRQKKLFNTIRDYEMCQVQTYLHILGLSHGYLVEIISNKDKKISGNILSVEYNPIYYENTILESLSKFINFMMLLFHPLYISNKNAFTQEEKDTICHELINGDSGKFVYNLIYN